VIRLGLAAVWLASGILKALDPPQTYLAVLAYQVLSPTVCSVVAAGLPILEIGLGVLLLAGLATRTAAVLSVALLLVFLAGVGQAWARGLAIDCGCFGGGGAVAADRTRYGQEVLRDLGFLVLAAWLVVRPVTRGSLDALLFTRTTPSEEDRP